MISIRPRRAAPAAQAVVAVLGENETDYDGDQRDPDEVLLKRGDEASDEHPETAQAGIRAELAASADEFIVRRNLHVGITSSRVVGPLSEYRAGVLPAQPE